MQPIVFYDLETTGTNVTTDRIVQMSAIKVDDNLNLVSEPKKVLINPTIPIPSEATAVHGITDEMVKDKPTFKAYSEQVFQFFSGCWLGGFNIKHYDVPLLAEEFHRCGIEFPEAGVRMIDAHKIFTLKERRDLSSAVKFYTGREMENAHDAEYDNIATIDVVKGQMFFYGWNNISEAISFLEENEGNNVDLAGKIILKDGVPCFSFGKSKGQPVKSDIGFAEWMLKPSTDFPINTKNVVKSIIYGDSTTSKK